METFNYKGKQFGIVETDKDKGVVVAVQLKADGQPNPRCKEKQFTMAVVKHLQAPRAHTVDAKLEVSPTFYTVAELRKEYKQLRAVMIKRMKIEDGVTVRFNNAVQLYMDIGYGFMRCDTNFSDMLNHVSMYNTLNEKAAFQLRALV